MKTEEETKKELTRILETLDYVMVHDPEETEYITKLSGRIEALNWWLT